MRLEARVLALVAAGAVLTVAVVVAVWQGHLIAVDGVPHVRACGTHHSLTSLNRLAAERALQATVWRGRPVEVPLAAVPPGTARLETGGGPRRHFWLVHDARGLVAFRATPAVLWLREEDVDFRARWTGAGWEARVVTPGDEPVFFYHRIAHTFDREGRLIFGPAYRDLDRFPLRVTVDPAVAVVDTTNILPGAARATAGSDCYL